MTKLSIKAALSINIKFILIWTLGIGIAYAISLATVNGTHQALAQIINLSKINSGLVMTSGIKGTVYFIGSDCPPSITKSTPPCSGPYAGYKITVYDDGGKNIVKTAYADTNGNYFVPLTAGYYVIYTQVGPLESQRESNHVIVDDNKVSQKDLHIDTGIR